MNSEWVYGWMMIYSIYLTCISPFSSGLQGCGVSASADLTDLLEQFSNASTTNRVSPWVGPLC